MAENPILEKETLLEFVFVFAFMIISIILIASIRFISIYVLSAFGVETACPLLLVAIYLFFGALILFRPFDKKYIIMFACAILAMYGIYRISDGSNFIVFEAISGVSTYKCDLNTIFWFMLMMIMLAVSSTLIFALKFFRERYPELLKKLK